MVELEMVLSLCASRFVAIIMKRQRKKRLKKLQNLDASVVKK